MTECNGCGGCCNPVALAYSKEQVRWMVPAESDLPVTRPGEVRIDRRTRRWILRELTEIDRAEAERLRPDLAGRVGRARLPDGTYSDEPTRYYRCRWYDDDTRRCMNYDDRPDVCRDYPPSGPVPPGMEPGLPPTCSFRADYGLPVAEWQPVTIDRKLRRA